MISYRKKLVEYYRKYNIDVTPEEMIVTTGGSEAILFAMNSCLDPGDEIIIPEPFYANYNGFSLTSDIVVKPIDSVIVNGFALPPIKSFEDAITPRTKAIILLQPQ